MPIESLRVCLGSFLSGSIRPHRYHIFNAVRNQYCRSGIRTTVQTSHRFHGVGYFFSASKLVTTNKLNPTRSSLSSRRERCLPQAFGLSTVLVTNWSLRFEQDIGCIISDFKFLVSEPERLRDLCGLGGNYFNEVLSSRPPALKPGGSGRITASIRAAA